MGRRLLIVLGVLAFLAVSGLVARWLAADGDERARVERLLEAQARKDVGAMTAALARCDAACRSRLGEIAERVGRPGALEIVRYDSRTARALGDETAPTRIVWQLPGGLPTVQCVLVRRTGGPLQGPEVELLRLSAPIAREGACR